MDKKLTVYLVMCEGLKKIYIDQLTFSSYLILKILSAKHNYTYLTHTEIEAQRG